jgi:hypothetical protein
VAAGLSAWIARQPEWEAAIGFWLVAGTTTAFVGSGRTGARTLILSLLAILAARDAAVAEPWFQYDRSSVQSGAAWPAEKKRTHDSKDFEFIFTLPLLYSSSVVRDDDDVVAGRKGDRHADPDLLLKWSRQFTHVKLSAEIGVTLERYATVREADSDAIAAAVKMELTDGRSDLFVPYLGYEQTLEYLPTFAKRDETLHDFEVGFTSGIGIGRDGALISYGDADEPGRTSVKLDARVERRFAEPRALDRLAVKVGIDFTRTVTKDYSLSITPQFRARWYDDYFGKFRRDLRPGIELKATWTPDWLTRPLPGAELEFLLTFERNYSNLVDKRYTLWELGPALVLRSKF